MSDTLQSILNLKLPEKKHEVPLALEETEDDIANFDDGIQCAALRKTVYYSYGHQNAGTEDEHEQSFEHENTIEVKDEMVDIGVPQAGDSQKSIKYVLIPSTQAVFNA